MFMQFEQQLFDLRVSLSNPEATRAVDHFGYLPPVGIVPLADNRHPVGFHPDLFLDAITHHDIVFIEGARVEALVHAALKYPPVDLTTGVMLWIYRVRENQQAIDQNTLTTPQPYLIFTTGHMAYMGDAHFDVNRWSYSNYS
jgi:hypothetical protein